MDRQKYARCVGEGLKGKHLTKEARQMEFCVVSKLCSGKSKSREEAQLVCSQPKPLKPVRGLRRVRGDSCEKDAVRLSACIVERIDMNLASNVNSIETAIADAMMTCRCQR